MPKFNILNAHKTAHTAYARAPHYITLIFFRFNLLCFSFFIVVVQHSPEKWLIDADVNVWVLHVLGSSLFSSKCHSSLLLFDASVKFTNCRQWFFSLFALVFRKIYMYRDILWDETVTIAIWLQPKDGVIPYNLFILMFISLKNCYMANLVCLCV